MIAKKLMSQVAIFSGVFIFILCLEIFRDKIGANKAGTPYYVKEWAEVMAHFPRILKMSLIMSAIGMILINIIGWNKNRRITSGSN